MENKTNITNQTYLEALNIILDALEDSKVIWNGYSYNIVNVTNEVTCSGLCSFIYFILIKGELSQINHNLIKIRIVKDLRKGEGWSSNYLFPTDKNTLTNRIEYIKRIIEEERAKHI